MSSSCVVVRSRSIALWRRDAPTSLARLRRNDLLHPAPRQTTSLCYHCYRNTARSFSTTFKRQEKSALCLETKHIFSRVPQPIAIVTAALPSATTSTGGVHESARAITLSSLTCLSLEPEPLVTFNVKLPSRALDVIRAAGKLVVNLLLTYSTEHVELARKFAKPMPTSFGSLSSEDASKVIFDPAFWHVQDEQKGVPQLRHAGAAKLYCTVQQVMTVADHAIVVARVDVTRDLTEEGLPALVYKGHQFMCTKETSSH
ncbi:flavin reductase like domain-domain-containing protein [Protomyces lactucae-debilis]|uniref:Flavin reductase like domain-domain-containing protein n=1 Tax=Protomyces lactucae-debilis TaxID=2754530 RepID=A0A1Y2F6D9_PROLT|nr:flavin reductase like domain-containing protein [Protomyces lactucae-debilis]ORY79452.1 flavin reductase like domain-domain-containing protein [Protomyces lactucae-debilis]